MSFTVPDGARLLHVLGAGTLFEVALVEHGGRRCICKRLKVRLLEEPVAQHAFDRECLALERVHHPAVPNLLARGQDARGPYVVETEMAGVTLRALVARYRDGGLELPAGLVSAVAEVAFDTLAQLHGLADDEGPLELVHGDLGPDHLIVRDSASAPSHRVAFIDYGLSSLRGVVRGDGERGTLPYVAPEVARGEQRPSQSSDVYALAATLGFAVLGRDPCRSVGGAARLIEAGERGADLAALQRAKIPERLRAGLLAAMAFDLADRLVDATQVLAVLRGKR